MTVTVGQVAVWSQVSALANLAIVAGYLIVPVTVLRLMPLRTRTRIAGVVFFVTCAITHVCMAFTDFASHHRSGAGGWFWVMLTNHVVQAAAVWMFVLGLTCAVRDALQLRSRWLAPPGGKAGP